MNARPLAELLGQNLRAARIQAEMTLSAAATAYGTTPPQLSRWENGHHTPTLKNLYALAATYNVEVQQLLPEGETDATEGTEEGSREAAGEEDQH